MNTYQFSTETAEEKISEHSQSMGYDRLVDKPAPHPKYRFPKGYQPTTEEQIVAVFFGEKAALDKTIAEHYKPALQRILNDV